MLSMEYTCNTVAVKLHKYLCRIFTLEDKGTV